MRLRSRARTRATAAARRSGRPLRRTRRRRLPVSGPGARVRRGRRASRQDAPRQPPPRASRDATNSSARAAQEEQASVGGAARAHLSRPPPPPIVACVARRALDARRRSTAARARGRGSRSTRTASRSRRGVDGPVRPSDIAAAAHRHVREQEARRSRPRRGPRTFAPSPVRRLRRRRHPRRRADRPSKAASGAATKGSCARHVGTPAGRRRPAPPPATGRSRSRRSRRAQGATALLGNLRSWRLRRRPSRPIRHRRAAPGRHDLVRRV